MVYKDSCCVVSGTLVKKIEDRPAHDTGSNNVLGKNLVRNFAFDSNLVDWRIPLGSSWTGKRGFGGDSRTKSDRLLKDLNTRFRSAVIAGVRPNFQ